MLFVIKSLKYIFTEVVAEMTNKKTLGTLCIIGTTICYGLVPAFSFMAFTLLYTPCFAAIGAIKQETNSWKWPLVMSAITLVTAYVVSFLIYNIGLLAGFG